MIIRNFKFYELIFSMHNFIILKIKLIGFELNPLSKSKNTSFKVEKIVTVKES